MKVVQVCELTEFNETTTVVGNCEYVPFSSGLLPDLSIENALILSGAVVGLLALSWVFKQVRNAF